MSWGMLLEVTGPAVSSRWTTHGALRVPEITVYFWIIKGLSTAMGESTSDYLVHELHPVPAVLLGFVGFVAGARAAVLEAPLPGLDLLVRGRHGRRLRHDGG